MGSGLALTPCWELCKHDLISFYHPWEFNGIIRGRLSYEN